VIRHVAQILHRSRNNLLPCAVLRPLSEAEVRERVSQRAGRGVAAVQEEEAIHPLTVVPLHCQPLHACKQEMAQPGPQVAAQLTCSDALQGTICWLQSDHPGAFCPREAAGLCPNSQITI